jgi:protein-arginine kinase activator protein McsA
MEKLERLSGLKKQLKEAVAGEKFELAVSLRDEIRALEATL